MTDQTPEARRWLSGNCPDPAAHEGVTFTVDSLAAAMREWLDISDTVPDEDVRHDAAAIIKAAKEASE